MSRANQLNGSEWLKRSFSIWRGLGRDTDSTDHPAPFPVALAERVIECYAADPTGIVLDPFAGSGSTLVAALQAGMSAVGVDINPAFRDLFASRVEHDASCDRWCYHVMDSRDLGRVVDANSIELCVTSPPYWDIMSRRRSADGKVPRPYSGSESDLGNATSYEEFLRALAAVAAEVESALRPGGYFVLNVMDIRKKSAFYPLHSDSASLIQRHAGLTLDDIIVWDRQAEYNAMRPLGYPHKFIINKVHEYLLVFRKAN